MDQLLVVIDKYHAEEALIEKTWSTRSADDNAKMIALPVFTAEHLHAAGRGDFFDASRQNGEHNLGGAAKCAAVFEFDVNLMATSSHATAGAPYHLLKLVDRIGHLRAPFANPLP